LLLISEQATNNMIPSPKNKMKPIKKKTLFILNFTLFHHRQTPLPLPSSSKEKKTT
jgi:hypothetical protein